MFEITPLCRVSPAMTGGANAPPRLRLALPAAAAIMAQPVRRQTRPLFSAPRMATTISSSSHAYCGQPAVALQSEAFDSVVLPFPEASALLLRHGVI